MNSQPTKVVVIFDVGYGDRIIDLAKRSHVWVIDSAENKLAAEHYMADLKKRHIDDEEAKLSLTVFTPKKLDSGFLEILEEHHGKYAQNPSWNELEVIGLHPDSDIKKALNNCGFQKIKINPEGFIANKENLSDI